jgi:hypothetical protein
VDLKSHKKNSNQTIVEDLPLLNSNGRPINDKKKKDLKELLPYIPPIHHSFYRRLCIVNDISGNSIDYEME